MEISVIYHWIAYMIISLHAKFQKSVSNNILGKNYSANHYF